MDAKSKFFEPLTRMVASGESIASAADSIGCATSTAYRIAKQDDFKAEVHRLRGEFVAEATGKLAKACSRAVEIIQELAENADESVKLRAAIAILDRFAKIHETFELVERIEAIEQRLKGDSHDITQAA